MNQSYYSHIPYYILAKKPSDLYFYPKKMHHKIAFKRILFSTD